MLEHGRGSKSAAKYLQGADESGMAAVGAGSGSSSCGVEMASRQFNQLWRVRFFLQVMAAAMACVEVLRLQVSAGQQAQVPPVHLSMSVRKASCSDRVLVCLLGCSSAVHHSCCDTPTLTRIQS